MAQEDVFSFREGSLTREQLSELERMRGMLEERMSERPRRYVHSLGVSATAARLAHLFGVEEYPAAVAGLLHDWDKVVPDAELLARAARLGISVSGSAAAAVALLHGPVAARELPELFPEQPAEVWQAISRHTVGATDMTPLDMVVFIADAIEPSRRGDYVVRLRGLVGRIGLERLFFECLATSLAFVIQTGRYLYPGSVTVYNRYAATNDRALD